MTTGNTFDQSYVTVDGWKYYHTKTKSWSGGDSSSSPPVKQKSYRPVYKPAVYRWRMRGPRGHREFVYELVKPAVTVRKRFFPDFPKRARAREDHPYSMTAKEVREDFFAASRNGSGNYTGVIGEQLAQGSDYVWSTDDTYALLNKLQGRVGGSSFNAGVFLGEGSKALTMITTGAQRVARSLSFVRHGNIPSAIKVLSGKSPDRRRLNASAKDPASLYLEYTYGLVPLLKDVEDAARFIGYTHSAPRSCTSTATRFANGKAFRFVDKDVWGFTPTSIVKARLTVEESRRIKCKQTEIDLVALSGLQDPASVAWELLPYSFVADWFYPIGKYLQALNFVGSLSGSFVITHRQKTTGGSVFISNTNSSDTFTLTRRPTDWISRQTILSRTISTSLSVPKPQVRALDKSLTAKHCLNSIALLVSRFGSR